ncbi:hypothetical protein F0P96_16875 [Hymenobacter busanensis]|uniref:Uncharacterized protein n=1 Tax=Hymenobacter busanensis TaxID=2607656 RepID=A0A7L4ZX42_9BACT|nr:hypothetical protein [Hymenobacter busanensis]KAA9327650.1 hypothetical protein F0P96_16875 [Hymenobacter busanensis]QHJ06010.1 hypothetical protein GUY19_01355 [Hymenobacter busanensis]
MESTLLLSESPWYMLRVHVEASGPVAALFLITHTRRGTDVHEFELPYMLWESLGTRAAADLVARHYRQHYPEAVRRLGARIVQRRIAARLALHYGELHPRPHS